MKTWNGLALAAVCAALMAFGPDGGVGVDTHRLVNAGDETGSWLTTGRTYADQRFSPLTQIDRGSVARVGLAWHQEFDTDRGQEATPLMIDGVLYTTTAWSKVYAFDARTGKALWSYDPGVDRRRGFSACCDVVNRGVAVWNGKVYAAALDGRLTALDAKTGKVVWSTVTVDQSKPYTITGAPRVVNGKILIGNGGSEYGVRGYLSAYDGETGKLTWRFYTTPNPQGKPDGAVSDPVLAGKAAATWGGKIPASGGGGTVWESITYDPDLNLVFFGAGNGSPWSAVHRSDGKSDNLFLSSIVAVNADTGKYAWHYQPTPDDNWDFDATQHLMLATLTLDGKPRKVVMQANKNGFFYVIDRATGQLLSAKNYVTTTWATGVDLKTGRPIETANGRYRDQPAVVSPAPYGGHNWQPMAYDPSRGLVFIPAMDVPQLYGVDKNYRYRDGAWNLGLDTAIWALPDDKAQRQAMKALLKGELIAWDPIKQEARWTVQHDNFWNAGVLATAGGLVFQGDAEGRFNAYDADTGKLMWSYEAGNGVIAGASSYELDGQQYVAVMVGYGGAAPLAAQSLLPDRPRLPGRLLVFRIGGTDQAPAYPKAVERTLDLAALSSKGDVAAGKVTFHANCAVCHSLNASGHYLPNLRTTPMLQTPEALQAVVLGGVLGDRGMVSFAKWLKPVDVENIRAYILSEARREQAQAKGS